MVPPATIAKRPAEPKSLSQMAPSDRHTSERNAKPITLRNVTLRTRAIVVVRERGASTRRFYADDSGC